MDEPQLLLREKQLSTSSIGNALDELSFSEAFTDELVDVCRDDSPNAEVWPIRHVDGLEPWIGGDEPCGAVLTAAELLHQELSVQFGDDDGAVTRFKAFVNDQYVPRLDAHVNHRITADTDKVSRGRAIDELGVQVHWLLYTVIFRCGWKAFI